MIIHLIRHGMTEANEKKLYCGHTDLPVSQKGLDGLMELIQKSGYPAAEIYITSGMRRTAETLRIIYGNTDEIIVSELKEFNFGEFEMKSHDELLCRLEYSQWLNDIENVFCPGGECRRDFVSRVISGLNHVMEVCRERKAENAAVICHGGVIGIIMEQLFPGQKNFYEWQPHHGNGYTIEINGNDKRIAPLF